MQSQTLKRFITYSLLVASFALSAASARSQELKALANYGLPIVKGDCPNPIALTLTAKNPTSFDPADFPAGGAPHMSGLGDPSHDKNFWYTFQWKRAERCCQITRAMLTVVLKANLPGQSKTSPDAGNDTIAIVYNKASVAPYSENVYSHWPFSVGQTVTKQWVSLNATELSNINASGRLSFAVQDDSQVVSATLQLWGCCLTTTQRQPEELPTGPPIK